MLHVIGPPCHDVKNGSCMDECPADAIYRGTRRMHINPAECIGCGDCLLVCPTGAIRPISSLPDGWEAYRTEAAELFAELGPTEGGSHRADPVQSRLDPAREASS
jgi:Fe-S-cluster-containing hydrogenase component 2